MKPANTLDSRHLSFILIPFVLGLATVVHAQQQLEEIVVTATMRETTIQDVPLSVSVVTDEAIRSIGAFRPQDLNGIMPNESCQTLK